MKTILLVIVAFTYTADRTILEEKSRIIIPFQAIEDCEKTVHKLSEVPQIFAFCLEVKDNTNDLWMP
jgi:hypothetical protein